VQTFHKRRIKNINQVFRISWQFGTNWLVALLMRQSPSGTLVSGVFVRLLNRKADTLNVNWANSLTRCCCLQQHILPHIFGYILSILSICSRPIQKKSRGPIIMPDRVDISFLQREYQIDRHRLKDTICINNDDKDFNENYLIQPIIELQILLSSTTVCDYKSTYLLEKNFIYTRQSSLKYRLQFSLCV